MYVCRIFLYTSMLLNFYFRNYRNKKKVQLCLTLQLKCGIYIRHFNFTVIYHKEIAKIHLKINNKKIYF